MNDNPLQVFRHAQGNRLHFWCPGCDGMHGIQHGAGDGPRWTWNGDVVKPTVQPSILVQWDQGDGTADGPTTHHVCHSFVNEGAIQFLGDCTHSFAGQTVPLRPW